MCYRDCIWRVQHHLQIFSRTHYLAHRLSMYQLQFVSQVHAAEGQAGRHGHAAVSQADTLITNLGIVGPLVGGPLHSGLPSEGVKGNGFPPCLPPSCSISTAARLFGAKLLHARPVAGFPPVLFPFHLRTHAMVDRNTSRQQCS